MTTGILLCGLNGCGKSTLGKALGDALGYPFIDHEDLAFEKIDPAAPYANPRSKAEAEQLLLQQIHGQPGFVLASVKGNFSPAVCALYRYVVRMEVPRDERLRRIVGRMPESAALREESRAFLQMAASRCEDEVDDFVRTLGCPILRVDGTRPVEELVALLREWIGL